MKTFPALALSALLTATVPSFAGTVTLDFEGVTSFSSVQDFYNGGTDSAGVAGSTNHGVSFSPAALALSNDALGPYFSNAPSNGTVMFASDSTALLNTAFGGGLIDQLSFYYSSAVDIADAVQVFSGLDGTGDLLASFNLSTNAQAGCTDTAFCHWDPITLAFSGIAHSITFGGEPGYVAFDNVTVSVPEPSTALLVLASAAGLFASSRRRKV